MNVIEFKNAVRFYRGQGKELPLPVAHTGAGLLSVAPGLSKAV
jgi:hypothetical protein